MIREELIATIGRVAKGYGYAHYTGMEYRVGIELGQLPALWIVPPKMVKKEGHNRGIVEYAVVMHLIELPKEQSTEHRESLWGEVERVAIGIIRELEQSQSVKAVTDQSYKPNEWSLTNSGEISIEVSFRVQMQFCDNTKNR